MTSNPSSSRLTQLGVVIIAIGFAIFLFGVAPGLMGLDLTPGTGLLQIGAFLVGVTVMTFGAYLYLYSTRHRAGPVRLREDIGVRLMATGVVMAYAAGFADVLGVGSHFGAERPLFGWLQALGVAFSLLLIFLGIMLYSYK